MDHVPTFSTLSAVYDANLEATEERFEKIKAAFSANFGSSAEYYARSPGRVNLIGEHIDYEGYGVFPMAIAQDTVVAIRKAGSELIVANLDTERYPTHHYSVDPSQSVDVASNAWTNYFMAAYKGVYEFLEDNNVDHPTPNGLQILVDGQVPTGAPYCFKGSGLSSSSALVCSCFLSIMAVNGLLDTITKAQIAEYTCTCERYSGTESGGMDQAISIMAQPGFAMLIEFNPVRGVNVALPSSGIFVVANSLAVSNKAETADERYNLRVVECRVAAMMLGHALGLSKEQFAQIKMLKEIEDLEDLSERAGSVLLASELGHPSSAIVQKLVSECLQEGPYSVSEVEEKLGISLKDVFQESPNGVRVLEALRENGTGLQLKKRASHVFAEAQRVLAVKAICESTEADEGEKLKQMGDYMTASHTSCRDLYECSCPELEELISVCNKNGAIGSRLTGAGWGGCAVSLIHESQAETFIEAVKEGFYTKRIQSGMIKAEELSSSIFASKPSAGAAVLKL